MQRTDAPALPAAGRMPAILGYGAFTSIILAAFEYTGGSLKGKKPEIEGMDEFERKQHLRTNRRRPLEETLAEVGEGRGKWYSCFHGGTP